MNLNQLIKFWNARERREKSLLIAVFTILLIALLSVFVNKIYFSITKQSRALENAKNDFYYVFEKAENALIYTKTQQSINQGLSIEEFLINEAELNQIFNLNISKENTQITLTFSHSSFENIAKFTEMINANPSISISSIDIEIMIERYQVKILIKII